MTDTVEDPARAFTTNAEIALPPSEVGGDHDTTNEPSRPNTPVSNGASGACARNGANGFEYALHPPGPAELLALTRATYATPSHNPPTTAANQTPTPTPTPENCTPTGAKSQAPEKLAPNKQTPQPTPAQEPTTPIPPNHAAKPTAKTAQTEPTTHSPPPAPPTPPQAPAATPHQPRHTASTPTPKTQPAISVSTATPTPTRQQDQQPTSASNTNAALSAR